MELLEKLRILTNCDYISDLRFRDYEQVRPYLRFVNSDDYSIEQWKDASQYLTGIKPEIASAEGCYNYLLNYSAKNRSSY